MGSQSCQVGDEKFSNWVKDTLALLYTKECLEVIADERSAVFHGQLMTAVGNNLTCTGRCHALDRTNQKWVVRNCPGVCQKWLDLIISHHSNRPLPKLAPRNTDPCRWSSDTWEVMKVYQSYGCRGHRSARDADAAALIDLLRNCDHFAPLITNPSLIYQVITVRNNLMHSKDFKVENQELSHDLQSMLSFLRSLTAITGASSLSATEKQAVQTAIAEVDKLRTGILDMTLNRELQLKALKAKQVALETDMKLLEQTIIDTRTDTAAVKSGLTGVEDKLTTEVQNLQKRLASQLSMIQDVKKDMTVQQQSAATVVSNLAHLQQQFDDLKLDLDETKKNITALKQQTSDLEVTSQNQQQESQAHASQLEKHQRELKPHTTKLSQLVLHQEELDTHTTKLSQLELHQEELDTHKPMLQDHETQLQGHQSRIESQHKTLECHGAKLDKLENKQIAQQTGQAVDIKGIQGKLIRMYEARRQHLPVYLLRSERKLRLEDIYVEQCLKVVDPDGRLRTDCTLNSRHQARSGIIQIRAEEGRSEARTSKNFVSSLSDVFYSEGNKCQYIYVSGNAGYGKSVFCSHLVRLWCKAHSGQSTKLNPDEELMAEFPLLFCVDLRDATYIGTDQMPDEICSLIQKQLQLSQLGLTDNDHLGQLLQAEGQVLVVMDALDECREERMPRRGLYNNCTTLVTSRPWKFEALRCDPECKVDKEIEIVGLKKGSPEDLSEKLVGQLNTKWNKSKKSLDFIRKMRREGLEDFLDVPLLLTSMLCLWFDDVPFGRSRCEIYKNSIHHQILAAVKAKDLPDYTRSSETTQFPVCQREKCPCNCYGELLWKVSELACKTLLGNVRERSLVMDHEQTAFLGLTDEEVAICMKLGILTQYKLLGNVTDYEPQKSVSFTHTTYQEWFAAIYLALKLPVSELNKILSATIIELDSALDLDQMFLFLCGLNEEVASKLSEFIMSRVSSDTRVQEYRSSDTLYTSQCSRHQLISSIQDVIVAGAVEAKKHKKMSTALQLHDVYIVGGWISNRRFSTEQILACDTSHARSVCISSVHIEETGVEDSDEDESEITSLPASSCLEKLDLRNTTNALDDIFWYTFSAAQLVNLHMWDVAMMHDQLEILCENVASAGSLRTVDIGHLTCITHKNNRQDCSIMLDLSQHLGLENLTLRGIGLGEVRGVSLYQIMDKLEKLELHNITLTHDQLESLCCSLVTESPRAVDITQLTCITHKHNSHDCYINIEISQYVSLGKLCKSGWQRPNVIITSIPSSSCIQTLDLRSVNFLPCDAFCDNFNVGNVSNLYLANLTLAHAALKSLCGSLPSAGRLLTVYMSQLTCTTHKHNRQDCSIMLDLSQHQGLEDLTLRDLKVDEVSLCQNMDKLEKLELCNITLAHDELESLCASLASAGSLRSVNITQLPCITHKDNRHDCNIMLDLSQHQGLEDLSLSKVQDVSLSQNMYNMEKLKLHRTKMTHYQLESLYASLASAGSLRSVNITQLTCKTHQNNKQVCSVMLDLSRHQGLENLTLIHDEQDTFQEVSLSQNMTNYYQLESLNLGMGELLGLSLCRNMEKLENVGLHNVILTHAQLKNLCRSLASAGSLKTVDIICLTCITHKNNRQDCSLMLDLSQHQGLETLTLLDLSVGEVQEVSLCQNMDKLENIWLYNITLSHGGLESLCVSLTSAAESLRTVNIRKLNCKTHEDNRRNCYINLDVSQFASLEKIFQSGWQRPNVRITALPSSVMQTVDLRRLNILPTDIFCVGQQTRL